MKKKAEIKALKARVEVLEFKEAAKGERFILGRRCEVYQEIKWISEDGKRVVTGQIAGSLRNVIKFNGNYVEVYNHVVGLIGSYRVKNDVLVDMDIEVYRKAFYPEQKANDDENLLYKMSHAMAGQIRPIRNN